MSNHKPVRKGIPATELQSQWGSGLSLFPKPLELEMKPQERRPYEPLRDSRFVDAMKRCEEFRAIPSWSDVHGL